MDTLMLAGGAGIAIGAVELIKKQTGLTGYKAYGVMLVLVAALSLLLYAPFVGWLADARDAFLLMLGLSSGPAALASKLRARPSASTVLGDILQVEPAPAPSKPPSPPSALLGLLVVVGLCFAAPFVLTGCAALRSAAPVVADVVRTVKEFSVVLDLIEARASGDEDIARAVGAARTALEIAEKASAGAEHLSKEEVDEAFAAFEAAYEDLFHLLDRNGLLDVDGGLLGASTAAGDGSPIPTPLEVSERIEATGGE